jgi:excisionase family DNA binding protein
VAAAVPVLVRRYCAPRRGQGTSHAFRPFAPSAVPVLALRLPEAARSLGVSVRTVQRLIASGDLPASRIGRVVVVEARALAALLAQTRIGRAD